MREWERLWYLGRENVIASGTPTQKFLAFFEPKEFLVLHNAIACPYCVVTQTQTQLIIYCFRIYLNLLIAPEISIT